MTSAPVLADAEIVALHEALDGEYRAFATDEQIIADYDRIRPFTTIAEVERRRIRAPEHLFTRYGIDIPDISWHHHAPRSTAVDDARAAGVAAEIDNAAMYEHLGAATERPDIAPSSRVFAAPHGPNHLPAFRRCQRKVSGDRKRTTDLRNGGAADAPAWPGNSSE